MTVILPGMSHPAPLLICAALALASPAGAAPCDGMADLLSFIADRTDYPVPADCPVILRSHLLDHAKGLRSQVGAYQPASGNILLGLDLDTESPAGRSYLLHELVHAAQYRAGVETRVRCEAELEAEAYAVQAAYLRAMNEGREALVLSWLAEGLTRCPGAAIALDY